MQLATTAPTNSFPRGLGHTGPASPFPFLSVLQTGHFDYGDRFDAKSLKTLPPGSVYSEPGGVAHNHFARTDKEAVIVRISGYGPTDTRYFDPANEPKPQQKK